LGEPSNPCQHHNGQHGKIDVKPNNDDDDDDSWSFCQDIILINFGDWAPRGLELQLGPTQVTGDGHFLCILWIYDYFTQLQNFLLII